MGDRLTAKVASWYHAEIKKWQIRMSLSKVKSKTKSQAKTPEGLAPVVPKNTPTPKDAGLTKPLKPYLKWAGAKTKLSNTIGEIMPANTKRLIEPFGGSGAVGLNLSSKVDKVVMADVNPDVINCHKRVVADPNGLIQELKSLFIAENRQTEGYNKLREEFNSTKDLSRRTALFIFLNRHCFNGICRYSSKGLFNTPCGKYDNPYLPAEEILQFSEKMKNVEFVVADFRDIMAIAKEGDYLYCDPPYAPLTPTANFTAYAVGAFGSKEQEDIAKLAREASQRGAVVAISNHDTPYTRKIYVGAEFKTLQVGRSLAAKGTSRGKASEIIAVFKK